MPFFGVCFLLFIMETLNACESREDGVMNPDELINRLGPAGSRPLSFHTPPPLPRVIVRLSQTMISLRAALSKCSCVQSGQPLLLKGGHMTRILPLDICKGGGQGHPSFPRRPLFSLAVLSFLEPPAPHALSTSPQGRTQVWPGAPQGPGSAGTSRCPVNVCGRQEAKSTLTSALVVPSRHSEAGASEPFVLSDASSGTMKLQVVWLVCCVTRLSCLPDPLGKDVSSSPGSLVTPTQ